MPTFIAFSFLLSHFHTVFPFLHWSVLFWPSFFFLPFNPFFLSTLPSVFFLLFPAWHQFFPPFFLPFIPAILIAFLDFCGFLTSVLITYTYVLISYTLPSFLPEDHFLSFSQYFIPLIQFHFSFLPPSFFLPFTLFNVLFSSISFYIYF